MPERYVLDASVAAKWYFGDEDFLDEAERILLELLGRHLELHAPEILKDEMAEAFYKAQSRSRRGLSRFYCEESYKSFCALPISYHSFSDRERQQILSFTNQMDRHYYDSCYVWLALRLECKWLTDDRKYARDLSPDFRAGRIIFIEDFQPK